MPEVTELPPETGDRERLPRLRFVWVWAVLHARRENNASVALGPLTCTVHTGVFDRTRFITAYFWWTALQLLVVMALGHAYLYCKLLKQRPEYSAVRHCSVGVEFGY